MTKMSHVLFLIMKLGRGINKMNLKFMSITYFTRCPLCGIQPYLRIEKDYDRYGLSGPYSLWHGNCDDGCPGVFIHHKWFNTPEEVEEIWNKFISECDFSKELEHFINHFLSPKDPIVLKANPRLLKEALNKKFGRVKSSNED